MISKGDIVELQREYSYLVGKHVRGVITDTSNTPNGKIYYVAIPGKYHALGKSRIVVVKDYEIRKIM